MRIYAIGDVHACYRELCQLLERMAPGADDKIWFCGDLVGRGPEPGAVLRLVMDMPNAEVVLGNHDLHLLAIAAGARANKPSLRLDSLLADPRLDDCIEWLRARPLLLLHEDILMVHASLHPDWDESAACSYAEEICAQLRAPGYSGLLTAMYGDSPNRWSPGLEGEERARALLNIFTRARYYLPDGGLNLARDGRPDSGDDSGSGAPWYTLAHRRSPQTMVFFGHWSALADYNIGPEHGVFHLDKGCVWGNRLLGAEITWGGASLGGAGAQRTISAHEVPSTLPAATMPQ